jgi:hypothetical protein
VKRTIRKVIELTVDTNGDDTLDGLDVGLAQFIGSQLTVGITNDPLNLVLTRGQTICGTTPVVTDFVQHEWTEVVD